MTYRHTTARRDPLSGAGARLFGGRWNPKDIVATVYSPSAGTCLGGWNVPRSPDRPSGTMLRAAYRLHTIAVSDVPVLDLRTPGALGAVRLSLADISDADWTACQTVGHAAWFLGLGGVLAPSATGRGLVLAAFESHIGPGQFEVQASEQLTPERYDELVRQA